MLALGKLPVSLKEDIAIPKKRPLDSFSQIIIRWQKIC